MSAEQERDLGDAQPFTSATKNLDSFPFTCGNSGNTGSSGNSGCNNSRCGSVNPTEADISAGTTK